MNQPLPPRAFFLAEPLPRSPAEERLHRKRQLAAAFRLFARRGFDMGLAGHITARDPERTDHFWVNPLGRHFGQIRVSDLILVNEGGEVVEGSSLEAKGQEIFDTILRVASGEKSKSDLILVNEGGEVVEGHQPVNRAAFVIHSAIHAARPDVVAAAHSHSTYGKAWSTLGRLLDPITQDSCAFYDDHVLFDDYTGVVLEGDEGRRIAETLGPRKAAILRNHGFLTVGPSVEAATWWFLSMDDAAHAQILAESVGRPIAIDPETARHTAGQVGSHRGGALRFRPLFDKIVADEPDLLD